LEPLVYTGITGAEGGTLHTSIDRIPVVSVSREEGYAKVIALQAIWSTRVPCPGGSGGFGGG